MMHYARYVVVGVAVATSLFLASCGISEEIHNAVVKSRDSLQLIVTDQSKRLADLTAKLNASNSSNAELHEEIASLREELKNTKENYEKVKRNSSNEIVDLLAKLEKAQNDLATREQRLREVERKLAARDSVMKALRQTLERALLGFSGSGLSVDIRNGKVYVSLSNQLLFKSGQTDIDKRGKEALKELATVLNTQPDISILVEGHTDNVPIRGGRFADNWDLSVLRSTEVTRFLTVDGGVDPKRIIASGRSEYFPIDAADSQDSRAKNRRTEIILAPRLDEIVDILK